MVNLKGYSKCLSCHFLHPLGTQNKDIGAALKTLLRLEYVWDEKAYVNVTIKMSGKTYFGPQLPRWE